nr:MAG TPA: ChiA1-BD-binding domain protein [Caudoviricetes sp.]
MALELITRTAYPEAGGYRSVSVTFSMNKGTAYINGGIDLPGKFATASEAEVLEEVRKQVAQQIYTGEATPALVAEYANLNKQVGILANNKQDTVERERALIKLVSKINKGNDKVLMALLLNVLDPKTINANKEVIINAFDNYEVNVDYSVGDKFKYENKLYEVLVEHTSFAEWLPSAEPTKYKEISLERAENVNKEQLEDDANRYVTKAQLDDALTKAVQTIMEQLSQGEGEEDNEHHGENSNNVSHVEGGSENAI